MAQAPAGQQQHPAAGGPNNRFQNQQGNNQGNSEPVEQTPEEIDAARTREISAKAVSGILLLLLKWLKVSRTLNYHTPTLLCLYYITNKLKTYSSLSTSRSFFWTATTCPYS